MSGIKEAAEKWRRIGDLIEEGANATITFPLEEAALALRIPKRTLKKLGQTGQNLGIKTEGDLVTVKISGSPTQQKETYSFLYGLIQNINRPDLYLQSVETPPSLAEDPDFKEIISVAEGKRSGLTEEDLIVLQLKLYAQWQALPDKTNLPPPENVLANY